MRSTPAQPLSRRLGFLPLVSPLWLVLGGLFLLPLASIFLMSFAPTDELGDPAWFDSLGQLWQHVRSGDFLDQYARSLRPDVLRVVWRSIWIAVATTVLCALIGYPLAYYIAVRAPRRIRTLLLVLAVVPFWTSFLIRTYAWMVILRPEGLLNAALMGAGLIAEPLDLLYTEWAVLIGLVYGELPFMVLPLYAALEKLDRSLLEASADMGAGGWGTFRRVTLPLSMPGLVAGAVLVFIPSVGQFIVSDLLGGAKSELIGNRIENQFVGRGGIGDRPFGAALAFQLAAIVLLLTWAYARWARRRGADFLADS